MQRRAEYERRLSRFVLADQLPEEEDDDVADQDRPPPSPKVIPSFSPTSQALHLDGVIGDIDNSDILSNARAMCHVVSLKEAKWAEEFSEAVDCYVNRDFEEALPLLEAALAKATAAHDKKILTLMIQDCQGPRIGVVEGKNK